MTATKTFHHLHHAGRQFVAAAEFFQLVFEFLGELLFRAFVLIAQGFDVGHDLVVLESDLPPMRIFEGIEQLPRDGLPCGHALGAGRGNAREQRVGEPLVDVALKDFAFVVEVFLDARDFLVLDGEEAVVLLHAVAVEDAHFDHRARRTGRQAQRGVAHVGGLVAEDGAQEFFLRRHGRFGLGRDLAHQYVSGMDFGADVDDALFVEVAQRLFADVGNVAGDFLFAELGVARHDFIFLDMNGGEDVVAHDRFRKQDGVFEVVSVPRHEGDEDVASECKLAAMGGRTVGDDLAALDRVADLHEGLLVDARALVGALELAQVVDVDADIGRIGLLGDAHDDAGGVHLIDHAGAPARNCGARVARDDGFDSGAHERRFGAQERNGLALHVRSHKRAVGVVVLEEGNERRRHRDDLLGRNIDEVDAGGRDELEVSGDAAVDRVVLENAAAREGLVGLRDAVFTLLDGGEVDDFVGDLAVLDAAVGAFNEAVFVDARVAGERGDESDVGSFRRLDRADAPVMARMHVAHFEAGALAGESAGAERRESALVGDLGERVGLVHELGELRRSEEFAQDRGDRLGVDEILGHDLVDFNGVHALAHGAFEPDESETELVLDEFAHRTDAPVAEVVDVVALALAVAQFNKGLNHAYDVFLAQCADGVVAFNVKARVQLHPSHIGQVVARLIEEELLKQSFGGIDGGGLARAHDPVDFDERLVPVFALVGHKGVAQEGADGDMVDIKRLEGAHTDEVLQKFLVDELSGRSDDLLALLHGACEKASDDFLVGHEQFRDASAFHFVEKVRARPASGLRYDLAVVGVDEIVAEGRAAQKVGTHGDAPSLLFIVAGVGNRFVKQAQDFLGVHIERVEKGGRVKLAPAVDAHVENVPDIELEVEPRTPVGNDARAVQDFSGRMGLAPVVVEEDSGRAVHLRDDDAFGAVDDEGSVFGHQRDVAHVDILLLGIAQGALAGGFVLVEDVKAQRHLERGGVGHVAVAAFLDVVLRRLDFVIDEFQPRAPGHVLDGEDGAEDFFESLAPALLAFSEGDGEEAFVGGFLHLDEIGNFGDLGNATEGFAQGFAPVQMRRQNR